MSHLVTTLAKKKKKREAKQQITAHLLKRFKGQPKDMVLGEVLKIVVKGKKRCGGEKGQYEGQRKGQR